MKYSPKRIAKFCYYILSLPFKAVKEIVSIAYWSYLDARESRKERK